jgi:hypothetical protein
MDNLSVEHVLEHMKEYKISNDVIDYFRGNNRNKFFDLIFK